jgi:hypothetical protein
MRKLACDFKSQVSTIPPQRLFYIEYEQNRIMSTFPKPNYFILDIGEGGIRTLGNSRYAGFQNQDLKPLGHLSFYSFGTIVDRLD